MKVISTRNSLFAFPLHYSELSTTDNENNLHCQLEKEIKYEANNLNNSCDSEKTILTILAVHG